MAETLFEELKRYVRFDKADEAALRSFAPRAEAHFPAVIDQFYGRLLEHEASRRMLSSPEQLPRLRCTLEGWLKSLFTGPWDEAYYERRARIGKVHVGIELPQLYMFGAMDLVRIAFVRIVADELGVDTSACLRTRSALHKILDLELAIILESYREAFVEHVQILERHDRARLEQQLALSEARYDDIVEKAGALIATISPDGKINVFNGKCESVTGLARAEAAGLSFVELFVPEHDRTRVRRQHSEVLSGGRAEPYEGLVKGKALGRRVRWNFTTLPGGHEPVLCAIGIDVSDEYELGLRTRRSERLAALGTMAAGLAHEIRNPLNAAHLQLSVAQRRLARASEPELEAGRAAVALAAGEVQRLAGLVSEFLQFAGPQPLRLASADLAATTRVTVALLAPEAASANVELGLDAQLPVKLCFDEEKMKQVLINLIRNAIEATGKGGHVKIKIGTSNGSALLTVVDDGKGIAHDAPIFEPFFTTKDTGTGLGLAIAHRIVADHGGSVDVESNAGCTMFSVLLPMQT